MITVPKALFTQAIIIAAFFAALFVPQTVSAETIDLSLTEQITGASNNTYLGTAVAAGDLNDDGYEDLLLGARGYEGFTGAVYLFYGGEYADRIDTTDLIVENADAVFVGAAIGDEAGFALSTGDIDGNGADDLLIGGYKNDVGGSNAGAVYVFYGDQIGNEGEQPFLGTVSVSSADLIFIGEEAEDNAGFALSARQDLNGDGYDDVLIGARNNDRNGVNSGTTYLFYSKPTFEGNLLIGTVDLSSADSFFVGEAANDLSGTSVASLGDVDADGYDEMIIGAPQNDGAGNNTGAAYVFYGAAPTDPENDYRFEGVIELAEAHAIFTGESSYDLAGSNVSAAGDVNGDERGDLLIGAYGNDRGGLNAGAAYVVFGAQIVDEGGPHNAVIGTFSLTDAAVVLIGESAIHSAGYSVFGAGDLNADGYDDMLVGARTYQTTYGAAYAVYGSDALSQSIDLAEADIRMYGIVTSGNVGSALAAADLNNDQFNEVIIGAPNTSSGKGTTYIAYLVLDEDHDGVAAADGLFSGTDCDATDGSVYTINYADLDGDGLGNAGAAICGAIPPAAGTTVNLNDLNDADFDNDGTETEADCNDAEATLQQNITYFQDLDGDGLGNAAVTSAVCSLTAPAGFVTDNTDSSDVVVVPVVVPPTEPVAPTTPATTTAETLTTTVAETAPVASEQLPADTVPTTTDSATTPESSTPTETIEPVEQGRVSSALEFDGNGTDDDGDGLIDEANTLAENGVHPTFGTYSLLDTVLLDTTVLSVEGASDGDILVRFADNSVYRYDLFAVETDRLTQVKWYGDSGYVLVLAPKGRKVALVDVYNGVIFDKSTLAKNVQTTGVLKIRDFQSDDSSEVVVVIKRGTTVRVVVVTCDLNNQEFTRLSKTAIQSKKAVVQKTKTTASRIVLRSKKGNILQRLGVTSAYSLQTL